MVHETRRGSIGIMRIRNELGILTEYSLDEMREIVLKESFMDVFFLGAACESYLDADSRLAFGGWC